MGEFMHLEDTVDEKVWRIDLSMEEREFLLDSMTALEPRLADPVVVQGFPVPLKKQLELVRGIKKKLQ